MPNLGGLFDLEEKRTEIAELENEMTAPDFWDDQKQAQKIIDQANAIKDLVQTFDQHVESLENLEVSYELIRDEPDEELRQELEDELTQLIEALNQYELHILLSEPHDKSNAILELHPGAGGQSLKIGQVFCYECIRVGRNKEILKSKHSTTFQVRKPALKASHY